MTEAEILDGLMEGTANVLAVVSIYFTIVSAYVTALFYVLGRAPALLKLVAFGMLSGAFLFLGLSIVGIERMLSGLFTALLALPERVAEPPPLPLPFYGEFEALLARQYEAGVALGFGLAALIYLALFIMTFLHRWPERTRDLERREPRF